MPGGPSERSPKAYRRRVRLASRPYRDDGDLRAMQDLLSRSWLAERPDVVATAGDLAWWRFMHEGIFWEDRIRLWEDTVSGELVGYAWFQPPADLDWHVRRDLRAGALPGAMLDWLADRTTAQATASGSALPGHIQAWALDSDELAVEALAADRADAVAVAWAVVRSASQSSIAPGSAPARRSRRTCQSRSAGGWNQA